MHKEAIKNTGDKHHNADFGGFAISNQIIADRAIPTAATVNWRVQDMFMLNGDMFEHGKCSHASKVCLICIRFPTVKT